MSNITIELTEQQLEIITAYATLQGRDVEEMVKTSGVTNLINEALNLEVSYQVQNNLIDTSIKDELAKDVWQVQNKVQQLYNTNGDISSIIAGLKNRASKV